MKSSNTAEVAAPAVSAGVVCSYNEWDPLEEVIVGTLVGSMVPPADLAVKSCMPRHRWPYFAEHYGSAFPADELAEGERELEGFARLLEREGIVVRRPAAVDYSIGFKTPQFESRSGLYAAMPRDILIVVGDDIIEAPTSWRCRYFEMSAYRPLLKEYFTAGARWSAAPKPELPDALFDQAYAARIDEEDPGLLLTEFEPVFDAADFMRCGRDLFVQVANTTNLMGIEWLRRHLGRDYQIHVVDVVDSHPMHIDCTFVPLAPGKLLLNPERMPVVPPLLRDWEVLYAPPPAITPALDFYMSSAWTAMNVLSLDEKRVMVESSEKDLISALKRFGMDPIPCSFRNFGRFGGSFHCATLDVRRRGTLQSYITAANRTTP